MRSQRESWLTVTPQTPHSHESQEDQQVSEQAKCNVVPLILPCSVTFDLKVALLHPVWSKFWGSVSVRFVSS